MSNDLDLPAAITRNIADRHDAPVLSYAGRWHSWGWLGAACATLADAIGDARIVGLVARQRPLHIATIAGNIRDGRTTAFIHSAQQPAGIAADIESLALPVVVAERQDWTDTTLAAARRAGSTAVATGDEIEVLWQGERAIAHAFNYAAFLLLTSGTTGPPKRVPLSWRTAAALVASSKNAYVGSDNQDAPQIMAAPLGHVSGLVYSLPPLVFGGRLVLLERFEPRAWAQAVRHHRPVRGALTPAGIRMLLDADVPPAWLASLKVIGVGGSRLDPTLQVAFEKVFDVPVLPAFGATEFGGVIANWSLEAYREWGDSKRGSVGQPSPGVTLRVIDAETGFDMPSGRSGLLEAQVDRIGPDWIRTTDIASIDDDGFLFVHGRADGAINRGGFKILPEIVAGVIQQHPAVADAVVVGIADRRLGEIPGAAIELRPGRTLAADELKAWLKDHMVAYQVPALFLFMKNLPRNASMKPDLREIKALLGG